MSIVLIGSTSGSVTLQEPAVAGTTVIDLPATSGTMVVTSGAQTIEFADGSASSPSITNSGDTNTGIFFPAADTIAFTEGGVESMRIDSSGNVLIGSASIGTAATRNLTVGSPGSVSGGITLWAANSSTHSINFGDGTTGSEQYKGIVEYAHTGDSMRFYTDATERMRIDSSGNLLIGSTSASASPVTKGFQVTSGGSNISVFDNTDGLGFSSTSNAKSIGMSAGIAYGGGAGNSWIKLTPTTGSSASVVVQANGNGVILNNNATAWASNSDLRLKNIIGTYTNALSDIAQIEPVKFTWKTDKNAEPQVGVIAQSIENIVPEAISKTKSIEGDDTEYLQVRYTELIPLMIASIQELKATVDAQAARIAALEGAK